MALQTLKTDLISWWTLDEESGARIDSHGSNDLTDNNSVLYGTGKQSNAADFEATNTEYLSHADNADLSFGDEDFTLACWVHAESLAQLAGIMSKWRSDVGDVRFEYNIRYDSTAGRFKFGVSPVAGGTGTVHVSADNLGAPSTGTWYFIVAWHDSTSNKIHIQVNDGTADEAAYSAGCNDGTATFRIGANYNDSAGDNYSEWDGLIDEAALWNRILTSSEKTSLYNSGDGATYSDLVQSTSGTLALSGITQSTALWKRLFGGTIILSGALALKALWKRTFGGLLQFSSGFNAIKKHFQSIIGTLDFNGAISNIQLMLTRGFAGTLTFSSTVISRFIRFVIATIRLCLKPVAVVRTWLNPDADVDIV